MSRPKLWILFVFIVCLFSPSGQTVSVKAFRETKDLQPADDVSVFLPLVFKEYTLTSLVVTTAADVINGDTSNPAALKTHPGTDGISLREAILAINNGSSGDFIITFSNSLAGSVIELTDQLLITQDHVTISGFPNASDQPAIAIQISEVPRGGFKVMGSYIVIRGLRMTGLRGAGGKAGVFLEPDGGGTVAYVRIEDNLFEGAGDDASAGISFRNHDNISATTIQNVTITGNTFSHFRGDVDAIHLGSRGGNSLRQDIVISDNIFLDSTFPIELENGAGDNNRILNVQIKHNYFADNSQGISMCNGSIDQFGNNNMDAGNLISGTLIYDNVFENNEAAMSIFAAITIDTHDNVIHNTQIISNVISSNHQGIYIGGGSNGAYNNLVSDILIARNIFMGNTNGAIGISGGGSEESTGNVVQNTQIINNLIAANLDHAFNIGGGWAGAYANWIDGVHIINNTIADNGTESYDAAIGIAIGDPGNVITGVLVLNSILWGNTTDFWSPDDLEQMLNVQYSITTQAEFADVNGNIGADPLFFNPALGDYHLSAGSPAIDAGTSNSAPTSDLECRGRVDDPATPNTGMGLFTFYDMGAFEFNGLLPLCALTVPDD